MRCLNVVRFAALLIVVPVAGGGDEASPGGHASPASARLFVAGADVPGGLSLTPEESVRAEVRFFDQTGQQISGIEDEHFAKLAVTPEGLVTVADVEGQHFQKDLTAGAAGGTGTYTIGYGHDAAADEKSFGHTVTLAARQRRGGAETMGHRYEITDRNGFGPSAVPMRHREGDNQGTTRWRRGDGATGRRGDGATGRRGDGATGRRELG